MTGLIITVERARQQYGESARVYVDGFELDAAGDPITLPWAVQSNTWLQRRRRELAQEGD